MSLEEKGEGEAVQVSGAGLTFGAGLDMPLLPWLAATTNAGVYYAACR